MSNDDPDIAFAARWLGISEEAVLAMPRDVQRAAAGRSVAPPPQWLRQALADITPGSPGEAVRLWRLLACLYVVVPGRPAVTLNVTDVSPSAPRTARPRSAR